MESHKWKITDDVLLCAVTGNITANHCSRFIVSYSYIMSALAVRIIMLRVVSNHYKKKTHEFDMIAFVLHQV